MQQTVAAIKIRSMPAAQFVNMLLQRGNERDIKQAVQQMNELRKIAPNDIRTVQLMVELGGKTGKEEQVRKYLLGLASERQRTRRNSTDATDSADGVRRLAAWSSSTTWTMPKKSTERSSRQDPNKALALADFLGTLSRRRPEHEDARRRHISRNSPNRSLAWRSAWSALAATKSATSTTARSRAGSTAGLLENPDSVPLLMLQAEFADVEKNYDKAAEIYKKLLARNDVTGITRAIVLNNLAFLVALAGNEAEAGVDPLKLVAGSGPDPRPDGRHSRSPRPSSTPPRATIRRRFAIWTTR